MLELGKYQELVILRKTKIGLYLNETNDSKEDDVLLPNNQVPSKAEVGGKLKVFIYKDSEDRWISTMKNPSLVVGEIGKLKVVSVSKFGAFLDWGLEKDLFLPFREQIGKVEIGKEYVVGVYIDRSDRISATMNIFDLLRFDPKYEIGEKVEGIIYGFSKSLGAFVAVENKFQGMIPGRELPNRYNIGDVIKVKITNIRDDGKIDLSIKEDFEVEVARDAKKILHRLRAKSGKMDINDKSTPEAIMKEFRMSKVSFKRAIGHLMKNKLIIQTKEGIELC